MIIKIERHLKKKKKFQTIEQVMISSREPLEWHFKQLDHAVGLSFKGK